MINISIPAVINSYSLTCYLDHDEFWGRSRMWNYSYKYKYPSSLNWKYGDLIATFFIWRRLLLLAYWKSSFIYISVYVYRPYVSIYTPNVRVQITYYIYIPNVDKKKYIYIFCKSKGACLMFLTLIRDHIASIHITFLTYTMYIYLVYISIWIHQRFNLF